MSQDIACGDVLLGPDSLPRTVVSISRGKENLYRITPNQYGESFVCNESHILSLKRTGVRKNKGSDAYKSRTKLKGSIVNISVRDYLAKSKTFKHKHKLWRVGVSFENSRDDLPLSPYFLGAWLGDGTSRTTGVTSIDNEVIKSVYDEAEKFNLAVVISKAGGKSSTYTPSSLKSRNITKVNLILRHLKDLNLLRNKHIPKIYLTSCESSRLQLLAGIIDTDGCLAVNTFEVIQKSKLLSCDIAFLARSLGFAVTVNKCRKTCTNNGKTGTYYRITISGDCQKIPVRIERKKAPERVQKKNHLVSGFKVEFLGIGDYFGFEIKGCDRLFLLGDFTVTHNTVIAASMVASATGKGKRVFFTVHRRELLEQTALTFQGAGIKFGFIAAGLPQNHYQKCQIISIDTAKNRIGRMPVPDLVIVDEAHLSLAAGWLRVVDAWKNQGARFIFLTATPCRADGRGLNLVADAIVLGPSVAWLIEQEYLSRYRYFSPGKIDVSGIQTRLGDYVQSELEERVNRPKITGDAIEHYRRLAPDTRAVAFCVSVAHARAVADQFTAAGIPAACLSGLDKEDRPPIIRDFADGKIRVLTNVEIITTGFDLSAQVGRDVTIDCIILLRPTQSLSLFLQMVGRGLRRKPYPAIILDHAGCALSHGLPCDDRAWSLSDRPAKKSSQQGPAVRECPKCYCVHRPAASCPECGHIYPAKPRQIDHVEGDLQEIHVSQPGVAHSKPWEIVLQRELYNLVQAAKMAGIQTGIDMTLIKTLDAVRLKDHIDSITNKLAYC